MSTQYMSSYSPADRATIFAGREETYRVNVMRHTFGRNYERVETRWFRSHEEAQTFVADSGCDLDVNMGPEWFADDARADHDAKTVCLIVHR